MNRFRPEHKNKVVYSKEYGPGRIIQVNNDVVTVAFPRSPGDFSMVGGLRYSAKDGSGHFGDRISF
jgi:hypothetical protein